MRQILFIIAFAAMAPIVGASLVSADSRIAECPPPFADIANLSTDIKDWMQFQSDGEVDRCLPEIARRLGPDALVDWLNKSGIKAVRKTDLREDTVHFTWVISKEGGGSGKLLHGTSFAWLKLWFAWSEAYSLHWKDGEKVKLYRGYTYI